MVLNRNLAKCIRPQIDQVKDLALLDVYGRIAHTLTGLAKEQHDELVSRFLMDLGRSCHIRIEEKNIINKPYSTNWLGELAKHATVQIAYVIGLADPVSVLVDTHGTGSVADDKLEAAVRSTFDLTPRGIIESLELRRPIYRQTA